MVRLSKIYTKFGDAGITMLGDGDTVPKQCPRVEAYGSVDEANAAVGLAVFALADHPDLQAAVASTQHDLFDVGADLCTPIESNESPGAKLRITQPQIDRLESLIDQHNEGLPALNSFVLPGGSPASAHLHLARTATRRAERRTAELLTAEREATNPLALIYLNRLSDLFFVLSRRANTLGDTPPGDVLWVPGANRDDSTP